MTPRMVFSGTTTVTHSDIVGGNQVIFAPTYVASSTRELEEASKQMNESVLASYVAECTGEIRMTHVLFYASRVTFTNKLY
jgi:hypothetical protein